MKKKKVGYIAGVLILVSTILYFYIVCSTSYSFSIQQGKFCIQVAEGTLYPGYHAEDYFERFNDSDEERLKNVCLESGRRYPSVSVNDRATQFIPLLHLFTRGTFYKAIWNGNVVYFEVEGLMGPGEVWVNKYLSLPLLNPESIKCIIISDDLMNSRNEVKKYADKAELESFFNDYKTCLNELNGENKAVEIRVYYENSDDGVYERFDIKGFLKQMERQEQEGIIK